MNGNNCFLPLDPLQPQFGNESVGRVNKQIPRSQDMKRFLLGLTISLFVMFSSVPSEAASPKNESPSPAKYKEKQSNNNLPIPGILPHHRSDLNKWLRSLRDDARSGKKPGKAAAYHSTVLALGDLISNDPGIYMNVRKMIAQVPEQNRAADTVDDLLAILNAILHQAPKFNDPSHFPMSALFVYMMNTPAGEYLFTNKPFNVAIGNILQEYTRFLDSKDSLYVLDKDTGWLSKKSFAQNSLNSYVIPNINGPHGGFKSFNAFFHRKIKSKLRPVAAPDDMKTIVSANDGTVYNIAHKVKKTDKFWIKSQPYSLAHMLDNSPYLDRFVGGDILQTFLSGNDYHRWHSPIDGIVREARVVNGFMFSELASEGLDIDAGILSQGYEASVNTRGLVFIESDDPALGMVVVIPIGITEISSITIGVKAGQRVKKGEEIGYFSYGGSSMALVFQPKALQSFDQGLKKGVKVKVNAKIAKAR